MNVKDKIKRLREVVVSETKPDNNDVLWVKREADSSYTLLINDGLEWVAPKVSKSDGVSLSDRQLEAIRNAERITVLGDGYMFLADNGIYKPLDSFLQGYARMSDVPVNTSQLNNDSGFVTESDMSGGYYTKSEVDSKISQSGGGVSSYTKLTDKPSIGGVEIDGSKTLDDFGIASKKSLSSYIKESQVDRVLMLSSGNPIANDIVKTEFNKYTTLINKRVPLLDDLVIVRFNEAYNKSVGDDLATYYDTYFKSLNGYSSCGSAGYNSDKSEWNFFIDTLVVNYVKESDGGDGNARYMLFVDEFGETGKISSTVRVIAINTTTKKLTSKNTYDLMASSGDSGVTVDSSMSATSTNPVQNKVVNAALSGKVDKVEGKSLSTNDFSDAYKTKVDNAIAADGLQEYLYTVEGVSSGGLSSFNIGLEVGKVMFIENSLDSNYNVTVNVPSSEPQTSLTYLDAILRFTTGDTAPTVSFSEGLRWAGGKIPTIEANTAYEFNVSYCVDGWNIIGVGFKSVS